MYEPSDSSKNAYKVIIIKQPSEVQKTFLNVEYDTWTLVFSFLVPLVSFLFGFLFSEIKDKLRRKNDLQFTSTTFFIWVDRSIKSGHLFLKEVKSKIEEIEKLENFQLVRIALINLHLNKLVYSQETLFKALVEVRKGSMDENTKDYSALIVNLDFLKDIQENLYRNFEIALDDFNSLFDKWNDYLREFHQAKHRLIGRRADTIPKGDPLLKVNDLFNHWYKQPDLKLQTTHLFLNTLDSLLQHIYVMRPTDDEVERLLYLTQQTNIVYEQYRIEKDNMVKSLKRLETQLQDTIQKIEDLTDKIKNKKFSII